MSAKEKRAYRDRRDYLIAAVKKRRTKIRKLAVELKGGKCEICGYDRWVEALEFHHLKTDEKDFEISDRGYTRSWEKIVSEIDKCALLCSNCHREVHLGIAELKIEKTA